LPIAIKTNLHLILRLARNQNAFVSNAQITWICLNSFIGKTWVKLNVIMLLTEYKKLTTKIEDAWLAIKNGD